ncbi:regulatory protein [Ammoniphilus resinae]|uniref:Regulatory protein RecX n=1 Tax=Ammoniphilus resinae TaxID=861532 RepID=A0ABS4GMT8_9BACL|nr:regulatory protein [Ammoniphilus resinae]
MPDLEHEEGSKITSITVQKNNTKRYNIYVNGEYAFAVHEDILVKYQLLKGKELNPEEMREILAAEELNRAEQYALRYLSHRPRTAKEMFEYIIAKGFQTAQSDTTVKKLIDKGYINDEAFAEQWIEERMRLRPRGRYLLFQELTSRGIDEGIVEQKLSQILNQEDEIAMIEQLIQKKFRGHTFESEWEMKKKIIPFLQRKGFSLNHSLSAISKIKKEYGL